MNHLHWMKLYIGDELSNTAHMTPAEFGSYMLLKMHYWRFGCLPNDDVRLARIARVTVDEWKLLTPAIGPLFEDDWRDIKLEEQREEAEGKHKARVEAGRKGGKAKQSLSNATSKMEAKRKQPEPEPEPDPYSALDLETEPDVLAFEEKGISSSKRSESLFTPFPRPPSPAEARLFLMSKNVPQSQMDECVQRMMNKDFSPYDLEGVLAGSAAA